MRPLMRALSGVFVVAFLLLVFPVYSGQSSWRTVSKEEKAVLNEILHSYQKAWNSRQLNEYLSLFHSESRYKKAYKTDKDVFARQFNEAVEEFGKIESFEIYGYTEGAGRFNVMIVFANYGWDPVIFVVGKEGKKGWALLDVEHP